MQRCPWTPRRPHSCFRKISNYEDIVWICLGHFFSEIKIYTQCHLGNFFPPVGAGRCFASRAAKAIARKEEGSRW